MSTESELRDWRYGQTQAERLVSELLHLEGYSDIDPQHPLGGPDGTKDFLCRRDGALWAAACYFPPTPPALAEIKAKFANDFTGVAKNSAQAFAFFVNQPLTISERQQVVQQAGACRVELYHLERLRSILDSPKGCGLRLQFLRIPMTEEEQWAFWSCANQDIIRKLADHEARRDAQMLAVQQTLDELMKRTNAMQYALQQQPSHLQIHGSMPENIEMPTVSLSLSMICWLHRVISEQSSLPEAVRGRLRAVQVWIGPKHSEPHSATYTPPPPEELQSRMRSWIDWWKAEHTRLQLCPKNEIVAGLASFHHRFLQIHPFLDGNGRIARLLLDQAALELVNQSIGSEFTADIPGYFEALAAADRGDMNLLESRIAASLT